MPSPADETVGARWAAEQAPEPVEASPEPVAEEAPPELSARESAEWLMGVAPSEEELAERAEDAHLAALQDGSAVKHSAAVERISAELLDSLREENPGIDSPEAIAAMEPVFRRVQRAYGERAKDPLVLRQIYNEVGGADAYGPDPETERWEKTIEDFTRRDNAFTR